MVPIAGPGERFAQESSSRASVTQIGVMGPGAALTRRDRICRRGGTQEPGATLRPAGSGSVDSEVFARRVKSVSAAPYAAKAAAGRFGGRSSVRNTHAL